MENLNQDNQDSNNSDQAELGIRLTTLEQKIDRLLQTMNIIKHIMIWVTVASAILFILPLIGLLFAIPSFLSNLGDYQLLLQ